MKNDETNQGQSQPSQAEDAGAPIQNEQASSWATKLNSFSAVATAPQHKKYIVLLFGTFLIGITYFLTLGRTPTTAEIKQKQEELLANKKDEVVKSSIPVVAPINLSPQTPSVPDIVITPPQELKDPTPPAPPCSTLFSLVSGHLLHCCHKFQLLLNPLVSIYFFLNLRRHL